MRQWHECGVTDQDIDLGRGLANLIKGIIDLPRVIDIRRDGQNFGAWEFLFNNMLGRQKLLLSPTDDSYLDAPPAAKAFAMLAPMPLPPPVMTTALPLTESSGCDGDTAGYDSVCDSLVTDGRNEEEAMSAGGLASLLDRMDVAKYTEYW